MLYTASDLQDLNCDLVERLLLNFVKPAEVPDPRYSPSSLHHGDPIAQFFSLIPADISPSVYVRRIRKYANCSNTVYLYALAILNRLEGKDSRLKISAYNMHRLIITSVMIAAKFLDHAWYSASYYARVGGIACVDEMNALELCMLQLLDFRIFLPVNEVLSVLYMDTTDNDKDKDKDGGKNYIKGKNAIIIGEKNSNRNKNINGKQKKGMANWTFTSSRRICCSRSRSNLLFSI